jgi:hypothetical protein
LTLTSPSWIATVRGAQDFVGVADPGDACGAEGFAFAGEQAGGVESFSELFAGAGGAVAADQF